MTIQQQYPIGSTIQNLGQALAQVIGYKDGFLAVEGVGQYADTGKWLADPAKSIRLSDGHLGIAANFEYFMIGEYLYRAPMTNPVMPNGYRGGARFQMPRRLVDGQYLDGLGLCP